MDLPWALRETSRVHALGADAGGGLWVSGFDPVVGRVSPDGSSRTWQSPPGPPRENLALLLERPGVRRRPLLRADSCVWSLLPARDGSLWAGTYEGEIFRLDGEKTELVRSRAPFGPVDGLPGPDVSCIAQGKDGRIWTAGTGGVAVLGNGRFRAIGPAQGLSSSQARVILPETDGTAWIGPHGGGLNILRGNQVGVVDLGNGLSENVVSWVHLAADLDSALRSGGVRAVAEGFASFQEDLERLRKAFEESDLFSESADSKGR